MKQLEPLDLRLSVPEGAPQQTQLIQPPSFTRAVPDVPGGGEDLPRVIVPSRKGLEPRSLTS